MRTAVASSVSHVSSVLLAECSSFRRQRSSRPHVLSKSYKPCIYLRSDLQLCVQSRPASQTSEVCQSCPQWHVITPSTGVISSTPTQGPETGQSYVMQTPPCQIWRGCPLRRHTMKKILNARSLNKIAPPPPRWRRNTFRLLLVWALHVSVRVLAVSCASLSVVAKGMNSFLCFFVLDNIPFILTPSGLREEEINC